MPPSSHVSRQPGGISRLTALAVVGLFLAVASPAADAATMTYTFTGTLTQAAPGAGVNVGDRFTGTLAYDPAGMRQPYLATDNFAAYASGDDPDFPAAPAAPNQSELTIASGGQTLFSHRGGIQYQVTSPFIYQGYNGPMYTSAGFATTANAGTPIDTTGGLGFSNPTEWVLPSMLPPEMLDLSRFGSGTIAIKTSYASGAQMLFAGTVDSLTLNTPEPATVVLLGLGSVAWLIRTRLRRRGASGSTVAPASSNG